MSPSLVVFEEPFYFNYFGIAKDPRSYAKSRPSIIVQMYFFTQNFYFFKIENPEKLKTRFTEWFI